MTAETAPIAHAPTRRTIKLAPEMVEQITAEARQARPGKELLALIGGLIYAFFWLLGKSFTVAFMGFAWCRIAAKQGWRDSRGLPTNMPSLEQVMEENHRLRQELARVS